MTTINSLDPSQKQVLNSLVNSEDNDVSVVYGPPGTGKSQLIVSLLFELAIRKKKVLFVSQNTEALEVIERMIQRLEDNMSLPDNHVSLSDFCLKLYSGEHRTLKYIRQQRTRLASKNLPSFDRRNVAGDGDGVAYPLSYVHLDKDLNNNLENDQPIGIDELLAYYLKYIETEMIGAPVRSLSDINIRQVFKALDNFKDEYNKFATYNNPQDSLRFISKTNTSINLPTIHANIDDINILFDTIDFSKSTLDTLQEVDISKLLAMYLALPEFNEIFDLVSLQNTDIELRELATQLEFAITLNQQIKPTSEVVGAEKLEKELFGQEINVEFLHPDNIEMYEKSLRLIGQSWSAIQKQAPYAEELRLQDVIQDTLIAVKLDISKLTNTFPGFKKLTSASISELVEAMRVWDQKSGMSALLRRTPPQLEDVAPGLSKSQIKGIVANLDVLETLAGVLKNTDITIETYETLYEKSTTHKTAYNPFSGKDIGELVDVLNNSLIVFKILSKYDIHKNLSLSDLVKEAKIIIDDIQTYRTILMSNLKLTQTMDTNALIECINTSIKNKKAKDAIEPIFKEYGKYIQGSTSDTFIDKARVALACLSAKENVLDDVIKSVKIKEATLSIDSKNLSRLLEIIRDTVTQNLYADPFYEIKPNENLQLWHNKIKSIISYQNTSEFDAYIAQHKFISEIKSLLGLNSRFIDDLLENENITYRMFVERIVNNLVKAQFNSFGPQERQRIAGNYFDSYTHKLKEQRKNYYLAGLENLLHESRSSATEIANNNNWLPGISTMDKIRKNTRLINRTYQIMIATPKEVAKYIASEKELFDYVLFDEASQLLPGQALPSVYRAAKAVVVGDPHQMPPSITTDFGGIEKNVDPEDMDDDGESILDLAISLQTDSQYHLKVHYRSESNKLFEPSRRAIYEDDGIQPIFEAYSSQKTPIDIQDDLGEDDEKNFAIIIDKVNEKLSLDEKATFCLLFARQDVLIKFKDYVAANEKEISNFLKLNDEGRLLISTVTNCQGIEGDYSIIYLNFYTSPGAMWFFNEKGGAYKRLNVAITRQRKSLDILMANTKGRWLQVCDALLNNLDTPPNKMRSAKLLQSLLQNAGEATDEAYLERVLGPNSLMIDSPLTQELFDKLMSHYKQRLGQDIKIYCEVGWNMLIPDTEGINQNRRNVGFRLDIGVYSPKMNKFVLGIEMDGAMYHSGYAKEHSDHERQQVLESKGWRIHRIWSTNWLNNTQEEFNALTNEIDRLLTTDL